MAIVSQDQPFSDEYSAEVIAKVRELSPDLDEYVVTQSYLRETAEENLSPLWLRNKLVTRLVDEELDSMGIAINVPTDDICDQPLYIQAALYLRSKFDTDGFYEFLKDHQSFVDYVREVADDPDCIGEIVEYISHYLPLDEGWEYLSRLNTERPGFISSDTKFVVNVIQTALDKLDSEPNADIIVPENENIVHTYIGYLGDRKQKVAAVAKTIYSTHVAVEDNSMVQSSNKEAAVNAVMNTFERELARPDVVSQLDPEVKKIPLYDIRSKFVAKWPHTLEYYCDPANSAKVPSALNVSVMVATKYVDYGANSSARVRIIEDLELARTALGDDRYNQIREMLDDAIGNMIVVEEGGDLNAV